MKWRWRYAECSDIRALGAAGEAATYLSGGMHLAARQHQIPLCQLAGIQSRKHARVRFFKKGLEA